MKYLIKLLPLLLAFSVSAAWAEAVCSGHGAPGRDAKCVCEKSYSGAKCDVQSTAAQLSTALVPLPVRAYCENGGKLLREGTCECPVDKHGVAAYKGLHCEIKLAPPPPPAGITP